MANTSKGRKKRRIQYDGDGELTDSLRTRRVRRMNCSRSCFRRLLGILSLGITNRSRSGTFSPISCISPSTTHHSDLSSGFLNIADGENLDRRRLRGDRSEPASVRAFRNCAAAIWRNLWGGWILLTRAIIGALAERRRIDGKGFIRV